MLLRLDEIIGTPVESQRDGRVVASVKLPLIDPERGKVVTLITSILKQRVIAPCDVRSWGKKIEVHDKSSIVRAEEILRVQTLLKDYSPLIGKRTTTKSGVSLGRVFDYEISTKTMELTRIFVAKKWLFFKYSRVVISSKSIIEIQPKKVIVKDRGVKVLTKEEQGARYAIPA